MAREFLIQRFDDFDCVRFMLIYPPNGGPGKKRYMKEAAFSAINLTKEKYETELKKTLEKAKGEFNKELDEWGAG